MSKLNGDISGINRTTLKMCTRAAQYAESPPWLHEINVIVNLFFTFALMTFIHSYLLWENPMEATVAQKSFLPQDVHNPSLEVHS